MLLAGVPVAALGMQARQADAAPVPCVACQALSVTADQVAGLPQRLDGVRTLVRVEKGSDDTRWAAALAELRRRGARAGLHVTRGVPGEDDPLLAAGADTLVVEPESGEPDRLAFDLKRALAAARGHDGHATLMVAAPPTLIAALRERGVTPYVDDFLPSSTRIDNSDALVLPSRGTPLFVRRVPDAEESAAAIVAAAAALQAWIPEGLVAVSDRRLDCGEDRRIPAFLNPATLDLVGVTAACPAPATVTSDMPGAAVERIDLGTVSVFLVHAGQTDRFAAGVDVAAARTLTVEEIVARHQAAASRQAAAISTEISTGSLTLTFEAPGFAAPITITSAITIFTEQKSGSGADRQIDLLQQRIRVNGVPFNTNGGVPRLPIIEPERAAAPPLAITLSDVYTYRLLGRERIRGHDSFVVAFAPREGAGPLYRGRAWIDAATFGMVRAAAVQTDLKGPITASEQSDEFAPDAAGRWLLARSDIRQTYEGASVRTPIHRLLILDAHAVNPPDFPGRRAAAYASTDVMLRDTPDGYRYLRRDGRRAGEAASANASEGTTQTTGMDTRVVAGRAQRIRTFAFGVIVDPNISTPLPFAGLSYVDFNLFGTGTQFSGFFGGSYGQLAFSAPSVGGTRWQLAGRAFGIATSYNDRAFELGREQYALDIRQRPAQAAVWLLRPLSARTALRLEYDWDYTRFGAAPETAPAFVIPRNQNVHGIRVGLDAQRAGWQASVWGSYARRIGWRAWGLPGSPGYSRAHADFQRYGASILRSQAVTPRLTARIEGAVMSGRDLDRFSRYAFGTFDNRLHGYPAALVRYDRGAVVRTTAAWTALRILRLDGFADSAFVHDPAFGPGFRHYSGLGAAVEAPAPFGTLVSLEWAYGFQGVNAAGRMGTHVLRLSGYKVF